MQSPGLNDYRELLCLLAEKVRLWALRHRDTVASGLHHISVTKIGYNLITVHNVDAFQRRFANTNSYRTAPIKRIDVLLVCSFIAFHQFPLF